MINSNMIANKTACKMQQFFTSLLWQSIEAVFVTSVAIVFVFFVDKLSVTITILSPSH